MRTAPNTLALSRVRHLLRPVNSASPISGYGRSASYRRISSLLTSTSNDPSLTSSSSPLLSSATIHIRSTPPHIAPLNSVFARQLSTWPSWRQAAKPQEKAESAQKPIEEEPTSSASDSAKSATGEAKAESGEQSSSKSSETKDGETEEKDGEKKEGESEGKDGDKKEDAPPPPHGDKSPWQVFMDTLNTEFKKSKDWNEGTKALQSGYEEFTQNPTLQKAKSAYDEASKATVTKTATALKTTGTVIGKGAAMAWDSPVGKVIRKGTVVVGTGLDKATKPVRETEAFKSVKNVIDDGSSSRYGGWIEKEERKRRRAEREAELVRKGGVTAKLEEDPDAGTNVTLHKDAAWKEQWRDFKQTSKVFQSLDSMKSVYEQSDNPLISTARSWADTIGGFFAENETAMVIKKLREMDPSFQLEPFLNDMREYILPEVLDAYVKGDTEILKLWLSAAQYNVYAALMQQYTTAGLKSDGRILDIRGVEVANARLLEPGDVPVFVITCRTQEVHVYRNKKTNELAAGVDDKIQQVTYAIGVTRIPEDVNNPETRGWRLIELQKSTRDYY